MNFNIDSLPFFNTEENIKEQGNENYRIWFLNFKLKDLVKVGNVGNLGNLWNTGNVGKVGMLEM